MTTQEMHIEIDLELQKINSQINRNILPQEKDWFLNNEVMKFIKQRSSAGSNIKQIGFEDTSKRIEDVKDLIRVVNRPIKVNSRGKNYVSLPSDYFGYIRFDAYSYKNCNTTVMASMVEKYKCKFKLDLPSTDSLTAFTISLIDANGTTVVFNMDDLPDGYLTNDSFDKQKFLLIKALKIQLEDTLKETLSPNIELYWEMEDYDYDSYTFTLNSDVAFISIDTLINSTANSNAITTYYDTIYNMSDTPLKAKTRLIDDEFLTDVENSHLSKSRAKSPTSVIREGVLELSDINSVIFGSVDITYICKPNIIDLLLDSNLNVSDKVAKEITGDTIRVLKGILGDKNYQAYIQENSLIE